jgi:hypothetical protein
MKRLIMCGLLVIGISGVLNAQTSGGSAGSGSSGTMQSSNKGQTSKSKKKATKKQTPLNNRRNYNWKNGQQATPTGNEATGVNGGYSSLKKDTARKENQ